MEKKLLKDNLIAKWLDDSLLDNEKKELEESGELDELRFVLDEIDTWKVKEFDTNKGLEDLKKRKKLVITPSAPTKQRKISTWMSIAASILILVTGGFLSWNFFFNQTTTVRTEIAEVKTIELPNGSKIELDALSSVSYNKKDWNNNRTIELSGQAFFDVTKGSAFTVATNSGTIQVLGTQFNVNTSNNLFEVTCFEGKVKVIYNNDEKILIQGESVKGQENTLLKNTHETTVPNWVNGYSKYNKARLAEVVTDLQKYYDVDIQLPQAYENLEFTGTLTHKNIDTALQTLFVSMEIKYIFDKNNTVTFE